MFYTPLGHVPIGRGLGYSGWLSQPFSLTRSVIAATNIYINAFTVTGDAAAGDFGYGATYTSVGATSTGPRAIQSLNGVWFNLVLNDGIIRVGWWGAVGNNTADDTAAIQGAIDYAIAQGQAGKGTFRVQLHGRYKITDSLRLFAWNSTTHLFSFSSLVFEAVAPSYVNGQGNQILPTFKDRPALIVQKGRHIEINNIYTLGLASSGSNPSFAQLINDGVNPWWNTGNAQDIASAPYCGIAIDPFKNGVPGDGGYAGLSQYYTDSASGSSIVSITHCKIAGYIGGVSISTSQGTQLGDSISINHCNIDGNKASVIGGQDQNRGVSINDVHTVGCQVFVDCVRYGNSTGVLPVINGGIIDYCKWYLYANAGYGSGTVNNVYCEAIYSAGYWIAGGFTLTFKDCTFKFINGIDVGTPGIDCHLFADGPVNIIGGFWGEYTNLESRMNVWTGNTAGARVVYNGVNMGREPNTYPLRSEFRDCALRYSTQGGALGLTDHLKNSLSVVGQYGSARAPLGCLVEEGDTTSYFRWRNIADWQVITIEASVAVAVNIANGTATFDTANTDLTFVGDFLCTPTGWLPQNPGGGSEPGLFQYGGIGKVTNINGTTVTLGNVPIGLTSGNYQVAVNRLPIIHRRTIGTTTIGSKDITNVSDTTGWAVNQRIFGLAGLPTGAKITGIVGSTITINRNCTANGVTSLFDARMIVDRGYASSIPIAGTWAKGDFIYNYGPTVDGNNMALVGWLVTVTGAFGTASLPTIVPQYTSTVSPAT